MTSVPKAGSTPALRQSISTAVPLNTPAKTGYIPTDESKTALKESVSTAGSTPDLKGSALLTDQVCPKSKCYKNGGSISLKSLAIKDEVHDHVVETSDLKSTKEASNKDSCGPYSPGLGLYIYIKFLVSVSYVN